MMQPSSKDNDAYNYLHEEFWEVHLPADIPQPYYSYPASQASAILKISHTELWGQQSSYQ